MSGKDYIVAADVALCVVVWGVVLTIAHRGER